MKDCVGLVLQKLKEQQANDIKQLYHYIQNLHKFQYNQKYKFTNEHIDIIRNINVFHFKQLALSNINTHIGLGNHSMLLKNFDNTGDMPITFLENFFRYIGIIRQSASIWDEEYLSRYNEGESGYDEYGRYHPNFREFLLNKQRVLSQNMNILNISLELDKSCSIKSNSSVKTDNY